jgi:hypothetical protein
MMWMGDKPPQCTMCIIEGLREQITDLQIKLETNTERMCSVVMACDDVCKSKKARKRIVQMIREVQRISRVRTITLDLSCPSSGRG